LDSEHPVRPPDTQPLRLDGVGEQAVEELVDDRLQPPLRALRQHLLAEPDAALTRDPHRLGPARRKRIHARIPDHRFVERLQVAGDLLVVDERVDGLLRRHRAEADDVLRRRAETGAFEKMCGPSGIPVAHRYRRKIAGPGIGARAGVDRRQGSCGRAERDEEEGGQRDDLRMRPGRLYP
jgi:hypothetical protein